VALMEKAAKLGNKDATSNLARIFAIGMQD